MEKPLFEAETVDGLEEFCVTELKKAGAKLNSVNSGVIRFRFGKSVTRLQNLRVVNQVFQIHHFSVPRPKSLLGQQHFDRIRNILQKAILYLGPSSVESFRLEAAGRDSAVFQRLISQISNELNIPHEPEAGDLFLRVMPSQGKSKGGWELLVRQTIRPLATRSWRQFNYPGALAAPVAAAMLGMALISPQDKVLNAMCGSGTLLAEIDSDQGLMVGCDLNEDALHGAAVNLHQAQVDAHLLSADAIQLPFVENSFDLIMSDLPWGQLVGEVDDIQQLYPLALQELKRVLKPNGRLIIITQLKKLMLRSIQVSDLLLVKRVSLKMGRINPDIFLLKPTARIRGSSPDSPLIMSK